MCTTVETVSPRFECVTWPTPHYYNIAVRVVIRYGKIQLIWTDHHLVLTAPHWICAMIPVIRLQKLAISAIDAKLLVTESDQHAAAVHEMAAHVHTALVNPLESPKDRRIGIRWKSREDPRARQTLLRPPSHLRE